jgi:hypothetical protein
VTLATRAFGMDMDVEFPMPGVDASPQADDGRRLTLRLADLDEVRAGFPEKAERIAELLFSDGTLAVSVDAGGQNGYLAHAFDFGHARIASDGTEVLVSPLGSEPEWIWQRYLTGQVLPLTALLQGVEVFHACVMGFGERAIAVVGHSGVGKTTTGLHLLLRGLDFMSDDVLVAEPAADGVLAHPGAGVANVRPGPGSDLLPRIDHRVLGSREKETRIAIRRSDRTLPLAAMFLLYRYASPRELEVERLEPVDPRILLSATFNLSVTTPDRLARQLDVCARLERSAAVFKVSLGSETPAEVVADTILEQAAPLATSC